MATKKDKKEVDIQNELQKMKEWVVKVVSDSSDYNRKSIADIGGLIEFMRMSKMSSDSIFDGRLYDLETEVKAEIGMLKFVFCLYSILTITMALYVLSH